MSSAKKRTVIDVYLANQCAQKRVLGQFDEYDLPHLHGGCLGIVLKHTPGCWRLIVDLSSPENHSVNDETSRKLCSLAYISVNSAAKIVAQLGRGTLLVKVTIKSAYHRLPVHHDDRWLLVMG